MWTINSGVSSPDADAYNCERRLQVFKYGSNDMTEYRRTGRLIFTCSSGDPDGVTVGANGNVLFITGQFDYWYRPRLIAYTATSTSLSRTTSKSP